MKIPYLFDTHCHINFNLFKDDGDSVIKEALSQNIWMIIVGSQKTTSKRAIDYAKKYNYGVYAAVGLHPVHLNEKFIDESELDPNLKFKTKKERFDEDFYNRLLKHAGKKVVAIGEIGLDYKLAFTKQEKNIQKQEFIKQLYFAQKNSLPVIIHCRDAYNDILEILYTEFKNKSLKGVSHFFIGTKKHAKKFLDLGFYISFTGIVTFKNFKNQEVIKYIPIERILIETDAPYVAPEPFRGRRNKPLYVKYVAKAIAKIKNIKFEIIKNKTTKNAIDLFLSHIF